MIAAVLSGAAGLILAILSVKVIGRMRARGAWAQFVLWLGVGIGAVELVANAERVPLPIAVLLLILAMLLWSQRKRWVWQARNTPYGIRPLTQSEHQSVCGAGKK